MSTVGILLTSFKVPTGDDEDVDDIPSSLVNLSVKPGLSRGARLLEPRLCWSEVDGQSNIIKITSLQKVLHGKMDRQSIINKMNTIRVRMRSEGEPVNLSLKDETVVQMKKLLGQQNEPSPTSVTQGPSIAEQQWDGYKQLIDLLVTYFVNEILRLMLMHMSFFSSMEFR